MQMDSCTHRCSCPFEEAPTCSELCAFNCNKLFGNVTENCMESCECPCESACLAVCNHYGLGPRCQFACGCLKTVSGIGEMPIQLLNATAPVDSCLEACETNNQGNTEELAKCMTGCATKENSILLLGCVVQCSIGNWATAGGFVKCIHSCIEVNGTTQNTGQVKQALNLKRMEVSATKYSSNKVIFLMLYAAVAIGLLIGGVLMLYAKKDEGMLPMNDPSAIEYESPLIKTH